MFESLMASQRQRKIVQLPVSGACYHNLITFAKTFSGYESALATAICGVNELSFPNKNF